MRDGLPKLTSVPADRYQLERELGRGGWPPSTSRAPQPDGILWHAFRRLWATERKTMPVKDVAAAGGWKDITTLIDCYGQPDEERSGLSWSL